METINLELRFFLASVLWGIILLVIYDGVRVFRRIVKHTKAAEWLEDILFWVISGCLIFRMMYQMNDGRIRSFSILGVTLGMIMYHYSVSSFLVKRMSQGIHGLIHIIKNVILFLMKPLTFLLKRLKWILEFFLKLFRRPLRFLRKSLKKLTKKVKIAVVKK